MGSGSPPSLGVAESSQALAGGLVELRRVLTHGERCVDRRQAELGLGGRQPLLHSGQVLWPLRGEVA